MQDTADEHLILLNILDVMLATEFICFHSLL